MRQGNISIGGKYMKEPIRVLHVIQRMEAGGSQSFIMNLYRNIDRTQVQFDFLVHYKEHQYYDDEIEALGGKIYRLTFREDLNIVRYLKELNDFFVKHPEYKVVHGHMHSLGVVYLHYAKKYGVPTRIAHSHTTSTQNNAKKYLKQIMVKLYKRDATDYFACSKLAGEYMFAKENFTVINNAITSSEFVFSDEKRKQKRKELGIEDKIVIGNIGRIELVKNHRFTVRLFNEFHSKYTDSVLLLIGSGSLEKEIKLQVRKLGLTDCVKFLGNRKDVSELYMAMDAFLFPSLFEGLGIVGVEAQAAGTPVVCTDTLPDEINVTDLLDRVSLDAPLAKWIEAMERAIYNRKAHKDMSKEIIAANYDIAELTKKIQLFYLNRTKNSKCFENHI